MELVYLWVDKYKNISNQGFNLSSKFKCSYNTDTNELTINETENKIDDIFPKNISVLALIGENGSGKSALAEMIFLLFYQPRDSDYSANNQKNKTLLPKILSDERKKYGTWAIVYNNGSFYISYLDTHYAHPPKKPNCNVEINQLEHDVFNLYYNPSVEAYSSFFREYFQNQYISTIFEQSYKPKSIINAVYFPNKDKDILNLNKIQNETILKMFKAKKKIDENIIFDTFGDGIKFIPKNAKFEKPKKDDITRFRNNEKFEEIINKAKHDLTLHSLYEYIVILAVEFSNSEFNDKFNSYFFTDNDFIKYFENLYAKSKENNIDFLNFAYNDVENFKTFAQKLKKRDNKKFRDRIMDENKILLVDFYDIANLIDKMEDYNIDCLNDNEAQKHLDDILPYIPSFIEVDAEDETGRKFNDLSNGEKTAIGFAYSLLYYISYYENYAKEFNIILDEIETAFNPNWQRKLVNLVVKLLENLQKNEKFKDKKFMLTILSHSPFVLSDIPSQNVVFLENGKQKYNEIKQTFGANIHTLLSHGFFMKDLVGEFAASKIDEVISFLNGVEYKLKQDIIKIIDEKNIDQEKLKQGIVELLDKENVKTKLKQSITKILDKENMINREKLKQEIIKLLDDEKLKECENIINTIGEPIVKRQLRQMLDSIRLKKVDEIDTIKNEIKELENRLKELENGKD
ncbi:MAG: AAA family ATPase [Campylobacter sp.]|nr:AAA family ATPase [Campylobacter sp.]